FDLHFPACAVAVLDLDLPADMEPIVPREQVLLTGPRTGLATARNSWRIAFANVEQIDLTIVESRRHGASAPLVFARQRSRQDIGLTEVDCESAIELDVPNGPIHEVAIECDPDFQVTEVVARNLDRWEQNSGTKNRLVVHWREPFSGGVLTIRGI